MLLAYHNNPKVKEKYVARMRKHHAADQLIRGSYWNRKGKVWKGCAVGCTMHTEDYPHLEYEKQIGVPRAIARLEDRIFENLPTLEESRDFALRFLEVIPVGADLTKVASEFCAWTMEDVLARPRNKELPDYITEAINLVRATFKREVTEGRLPYSDWTRVREVAYKARQKSRDAAYAADAAATDAAAYAAYAADAAAYAAYAADAAAYAAYAAADAYADAADAAAYAAYAAADARKSFWQRAAAKLIELLSSAPVAGGNT